MIRISVARFTATILAISLPLASVPCALADDADSAFARKDYATALGYYEPLAEQGNAHAQTQLGQMYIAGQGVPEDSEKGMSWLRKAADQGWPAAEMWLGTMYLAGKAVPQDKSQAAAWYRKASDHGDVLAAFVLSDLYLSGDGVPKDPSQAVELLRKAAEHGSVQAKAKLGLLYAMGVGVSRDEAKATTLLRDAGLSNFEITMYLMSLKFVRPEQNSGDVHNQNQIPIDNTKTNYISYPDLIIAIKRKNIKSFSATVMKYGNSGTIHATGHFTDDRLFFSDLPYDKSILDTLRQAGAKIIE